MSTHLVLCRYNESFPWLTRVPRGLFQEIHLYNKGKPTNLRDFTNISNLPIRVCPCPNVGRESEAYLRYIIEHYDHLPEVVVFSQARLEDHLGKLPPALRDEVRFLEQIAKEARVNGYSHTHLEYVGIETGAAPDWNFRNGQWYLAEHYQSQRPQLFHQWFQLTFHLPLTFPHPVWWAALFAIRKDRILSRPRSEYIRYWNMLQHSASPAEGHFFERSWFYVFQCR